MDLSEVRPGDFVIISNHRVAWKPEFYFNWDATGRCPIGYALGNNTQPLPLTYHFLVGNGFRNFDELTVVYYTTAGPSAVEIYAEITDAGVELTIYKYIIEEDRFETMYCNKINYVHQLQHVLKDLRISKLELKLD